MHADIKQLSEQKCALGVHDLLKLLLGVEKVGLETPARNITGTWIATPQGRRAIKLDVEYNCTTQYVVCSANLDQLLTSFCLLLFLPREITDQRINMTCTKQKASVM